MKRQLIGTLAATVIAITLTGCGSDSKGESDLKGESPRSTSTPTRTSPESAADIVLAAGAAGPVSVGMSRADAVATGLFATDLPSPVDGCPAPALAWDERFDDALDVQTLKSGEIASIGVRSAGPETGAGLSVGSSYADVLAAHPGAHAVRAGFDQTGVLVQDGDAWIGYLFDAELEDVRATDKVSFIELTEGEKPSLIRDGC